MTRNRKKYVILVGDGMGDYPLPQLDGRTPLEAAATPAMDFVADHGEMHLLRTIPAGFPPGSDVANLSLMGYLPEKYYTGRAPLEAASMGVTLGAEEIAFRCNLVTLDFSADNQVRMVDYSAGHIATDEARLLIDAVNQGAGNERCRFYPGVSYRHLLVHKGELTLDTVPPHDFTGKDVTEYWARYRAVPHLRELLDKALALLDGHEVNARRRQQALNPANAIWLWGQGRAPTMPSLKDQFGLSGALISAVDLLKGIGVYAGMEIINVPGATGYLDTNYEGKVAAALRAIQDKDLVFVHIEAPDEASHQGLLKEKIQAIEDFDRRIVRPVLNGLKEKPFDFRLTVAMDHFTPLALQTHSEEPVPVAIYDSSRTAKTGSRGYSENNARERGTLLENGRKFIERIIELQ